MILSIILFHCAAYILLAVYNKLTCGINKCSKHLVGKVVIVTGANTGIGYHTAKDLAERGAKVILGCRNIQKGTKAKDEIIKTTENKDIHVIQLDLASFDSVRAFAANVLKSEAQLDILINNAGMYGDKYELTDDGLLVDMQSNHFGPFLLTSLLLPLLKASTPSRIINVSSGAHTRGKIDLDNINLSSSTYGGFQAYCNSKLCNVLMTVELAKRLKGTGVTANCLHPGAVITDFVKSPMWVYLIRPLGMPLMKTAWQGAQTTNYLAVSPEVAHESGKYYSDCTMKPISYLARDTVLAEKLWHLSEKLTKLK